MLYSNCKSLYSGFVYILHSVPGQFSETVVDSDEQIVVKRRKLEKKSEGNFQQNAS